MLPQKLRFVPALASIHGTVATSGGDAVRTYKDISLIVQLPGVVGDEVLSSDSEGAGIDVESDAGLDVCSEASSSSKGPTAPETKADVFPASQQWIGPDTHVVKRVVITRPGFYNV